MPIPIKKGNIERIRMIIFLYAKDFFHKYDLLKSVIIHVNNLYSFLPLGDLIIHRLTSV